MMHRPWLAVVAALLLALFAPVASAADDPLESVVDIDTTFNRLGTYSLAVDGEVAEDARFYRAEGPAGGILVVTSKLPRPALLRLRSGEVWTLVEGDLPAERDDATLVLTPALRWRDDGVDKPKDRWPGFVVDGRWATVDMAEPRIGTFDYAALERELPIYARQSTRHEVDAASVDALVAALRETPGPRRLEVYFGSTCGRCARLMPGFLAVERALTEALPEDGEVAAPLDIVYHGIAVGPEAPREMIEELNIDILPTAILRDASSGRELGRMNAAAWDRPAEGLLELFAGPAPAP